ncbi:hypothetical protein K443DRAFT_676378 [Laccaria amethystina LaAM-08-1]|uniref:Uncharacterized protein n=1 Tax=Laccaria amethystina LaAM-08-1 TaxID=1095629 RepID=A0A0C9WW62_9AGAR|nr:hypothetical protein K443DRAFT_676378 [Laccaria amethystina LaAM-08-1]
MVFQDDIGSCNLEIASCFPKLVVSVLEFWTHITYTTLGSNTAPVSARSNFLRGSKIPYSRHYRSYPVEIADSLGCSMMMNSVQSVITLRAMGHR